MTFSLVSSIHAAEWTEDCVVNGVPTIRGIECVFSNIINPIPALIALIAVGMIILAGGRLIMAGSDPKQISTAWKTLTWAVVGLILLAVAWLAIVFISKFTGQEGITTFTIPD